MLEIVDVDSIKKEILKRSDSQINFPKTISFEFPQGYKELVSQIKTIELSSECILFNSVQAVNETKEFSDSDYWKDDVEVNRIKDYWFFGANGQGDLWVFNTSNTVFFYDHNAGEISEESLVDLKVDFDTWLQFAHLNKQLENIYAKEEPNQSTKDLYKRKLLELSTGLAERYPFEF